MTDKIQHFPCWRYGPKGQSGIFESEADVPSGWEDHPSKVGAKPASTATKTATQSAGTTATAEQAAKTTTEAATDVSPAVAAETTTADGTTKPLDL